MCVIAYCWHFLSCIVCHHVLQVILVIHFQSISLLTLPFLVNPYLVCELEWLCLLLLLLFIEFWSVLYRTTMIGQFSQVKYNNFWNHQRGWNEYVKVSDHGPDFFSHNKTMAKNCMERSILADNTPKWSLMAYIIIHIIKKLY